MHELLASLRRDHVNCGRLIGLVRRQLDLPDGTPPDWHLLTRIMRYMVEYGDLFHHRTEEILYQRLKDRAGAARVHIDEIAHEHADLGRQAAVCSSLVAAAPEDRDTEAAATALRSYVDELEAHMYQEEKHLFRLANLLLSSTDWRAVEQQLACRRDPLFDGPVQEGYLIVVRYLVEHATPVEPAAYGRQLA
jgi:hemerythrin-like domain-containing protein